MTSYNKPGFVGGAIQGVLNQTHEDFELLLMDDNSNEQTTSVIAAYLYTICCAYQSGDWHGTELKSACGNPH
ncbi:hypothetical protein GCM10008018_27760 [Paenibacillus marchantiophytorum]|uniref:Glycosyltransferase 2-like domain-containing protein n=2 Tax=Paenibacillus marchantiophytorum TaxID=1619310 RepID=A0ABQ1EPC7_9BACL|nr:hypothetical protein GCM10008018_27760 [Paenibacillus marchantiophytorum]